MQSRIDRILVAVKPEQGRLPLSVDHARFLAQGLDAEIALVSCTAEVPPVTDSSFVGSDPAGLTALSNASPDEIQAKLEELAQPLRDAGLTVTAHAATQLPPYQGILDQVTEWQADLVIVGVHQPTLVPHTRLTETDWQLMRLCPCPLLVVTDPDADAYETILATVDPLRRHAEPATLDQAVLAVAAEFSDGLDARLVVANAFPNPEDFEVASAVEVEPGVFYGAENIQEAHRSAVADLLEECGITDADSILQAGAPAAVIGEIARDNAADLIVLGSSQRGPVEAAILGSTAEAVLAESAHDVLLVKPSPG